MKDMMELNNLIDIYEAMPRDVLAFNIKKALPQGLNVKNQVKWLAEHHISTGMHAETTAYSWIAPNKSSKMPFSSLVKLAIALECTIGEILDDKHSPENINLRTKQVRSNSKFQSVLELKQNNPEISVKEIAANLHIHENTVRRHLKSAEFNSEN